MGVVLSGWMFCIADRIGRIGYETNDCPTNPPPVHTSLLVELDLGDPEQLLSCRQCRFYELG